MGEGNQRHIYLDYLRILAALGVICIHTSCQLLGNDGFEPASVGSMSWNVAIIYDALSRFCVPMFLMISGALFLGRTRSGKWLYKKILRILLAYFFWSLFYALQSFDFNVRSLLVRTLSGGPRFGFLCYITGLYLITPVLNKLVVSKRCVGYYLILCFLFAFLEPQIFDIFGARQIPYISLLVKLIHEFIEEMRMTALMWIPAYYVLGFALSHYEIKPKHRMALYLMGLLGTAVTICFTIWESILQESLVSYWLSYRSVNVLLVTAGMFVFAKYELARIPCREKFEKLIEQISKCTFCVYLIHSYVLDSFLVNVVGISANSWNALISVPTVVLLVFAVSLLISFIVNQIPVLNRYIV